MTATFVQPAASENRFASLTMQGALQASYAAPSATLSESEIDALIRELISRKWQRVSSEYDDPLGMLFTNRVKQWTAGWGAASSGHTVHESLYVLAWDVDSWNNTPAWNLYENGRLIYQGKDHRLNPLSKSLKKLLEGEDLPFISHAELLAPLKQAVGLHQNLLFNHLFNSIQTRPEMLAHFQAPLFAWLEEKVTLPNVVEDATARLNRETRALQQLDAKNFLIFMFRRLYEKELLSGTPEKQRLFSALQFMQDDYFYLGYQINPVFRGTYDRTFNGFRKQLTDGTWQVRLKREATQLPRA